MLANTQQLVIRLFFLRERPVVIKLFFYFALILFLNNDCGMNIKSH